MRNYCKVSVQLAYFSAKMSIRFKVIGLCITFLQLIIHSLGQKSFHKFSGYPASCGNNRDVNQFDSFSFTDSMITNYRRQVIDRSAFINRLHQNQNANSLQSGSPANEKESRWNEARQGNIVKRASTFFSRNNLNNIEYYQPNQAQNRVSQLHPKDDDESPEETPASPTPESKQPKKVQSFREHAEANLKDYTFERQQPRKPETIAPFPGSPPPGSNNNIPLIVKEQPQTDFLFGDDFPKEHVQTIINTALDKENFSEKSGKRINRQMTKFSSLSKDDQNPEETLEITKIPNRNQQNVLIKENEQDSLPESSEAELSTGNSKQAKKLPAYIRHLVESETTARSKPYKTPKKENRERERANPAVNILQSLGPDKLEQLRQLLNAAAGPYSPPSDETSKSDLLHSFADQRRKYRTKREATQDDSTKCIMSFKKGTNCKKLVIKLQFIMDEGKNCDKEYLLIKDEKTEQKYCGFNDNAQQFRSESDKVTIEHSQTHSPGKMKFKGIVECES